MEVKLHRRLLDEVIFDGKPSGATMVLTGTWDGADGIYVLHSCDSLNLQHCEEGLIGREHVFWCGETMSNGRESRALAAQTLRREFGVLDDLSCFFGSVDLRDHETAARKEALVNI